MPDQCALAPPSRRKKALDEGQDSGYKPIMLLCEEIAAAQKSGDPWGLPMFFDDSAQAIVTDASRVGLFRSSEDEGIGRHSATPSARLASRAEEINNSKFKRLLDIVGSAGILLVISPLLLLIALAVRLESRGPALFKQKRYGVGREIFTVYKFRNL